MALQPKPHLSASQLDMLSGCGEQYRRRYVCGDRIPPGIAMIVGTGTHAGAEVNFLQKIESHRDLPAKDIVDAAVAGYEAELLQGYELSPEERSKGPEIVIGEGKDTVVALASLHAAEVAPDYQPVAVEKEFLIPFRNASHDLLGYIDLVDDKYRVVDFKTASKSKAQKEADTGVQLTIYGAHFQLETGSTPNELRLDCLIKTKKPKRQVLTTHRDVNDFSALINRVNAAIRLIQSGTFMPVEPGHWKCCPKWCGYWSTCPYVNSTRIAAADAAGE